MQAECHNTVGRQDQQWKKEPSCKDKKLLRKSISSARNANPIRGKWCINYTSEPRTSYDKPNKNQIHSLRNRNCTLPHSRQWKPQHRRVPIQSENENNRKEGMKQICSVSFVSPCVLRRSGKIEERQKIRLEKRLGREEHLDRKPHEGDKLKLTQWCNLVPIRVCWRHHTFSDLSQFWGWWDLHPFLTSPVSFSAMVLFTQPCHCRPLRCNTLSFPCLSFFSLPFGFGFSL